MPFLILGDQRILFIHIPRTGGTSVESWLRSHDSLRLFTFGIPSAMKITPQHLTRNDLVDIFGDDMFTYKFAFVRHPMRRLESEFRLHALRDQRGFYGGHQRFSAWLETNLDAVQRNRFHADNHFRPQTDFIGSDVEIFRYEDGLLAGVAKAAAAAGLIAPGALEQHYSTESFVGEVEWDTASRARVLEFYRQDFELLGYTPD